MLREYFLFAAFAALVFCIFCLLFYPFLGDQ